MSPSEYEQLLHDAEVKLSRLKALYEQFFQGLEKLEPTVPRKDLDRAFDLLRKQQPRNTALRFRTQMLLAKYGTYQTYWQRVARQIEEGTFRRDVVRAQQRRLGRGANRSKSAPPPEYELDVDVDLAEPESAKASVDFDDSDVDAILGTIGPKSVPAPGATIRRALSPFASIPRTTSIPPRSSPAPPATAAAPATAVAKFGKTGMMTFAKPAAPAAPASPASPAAPAAPIAPVPGAPMRAEATRAAAPRPAPSPPVAGPGVPPPPRAPLPAAAAPRPPAPLPPAATIAARAPGNAPPIASGARPATTPTHASLPAVSPAAPPTALDDARMRRIYDSYVEAKKRNNERVDNLKYEALAHTVQQMVPKLREKHGTQKIDFEVVVQNGKVGLKPKVEK
jgi:hypothetical protein